VYIYEAGGFQGSFPSEQAAVQAAAQVTGLSVSDLRKCSVEAVPAKALLEKYKALMPLYDHRHPGDIESAIAEQAMSRDMFRSEPALELLSLLGKYGPWRRNLHVAWRSLQGHQRTRGQAEEVRKTRLPLLPLETRVAALPVVIFEAVKLCNMQPMSEWTLNCGTGVSHVLGFLPMLHGLKLIEHAPTKPHKNCFRLGSHGTWYRWLGAHAASLDSLSKTVMAADALAKALDCPPTTCAEWAQKCQQWLGALKAIKAPGLGKASAYTSTWAFRAAAISRMRASGITELTCTRSPSLWTDFTNAFPDQKLTLARLAKHLQLAAAQHRKKSTLTRNAGCQKIRRLRSRDIKSSSFSITGLQKALQTSCPLELLTCKLCLASSSSLRQFSCDYIVQHQQSLEAFMHAYRKAHGLWPSPGVLLSKFRDGQAP
jgi:hypothetical protein